MSKMSDRYPNGECPDCGEPIGENVKNGEECKNCGHVFWSNALVMQGEYYLGRSPNFSN